ncbi:MAG: YhbY family RNA-binding protein [Desulfurococcales archaeon]|nr:YhbY family RNA-binding protein [Desulfurococcales archaeon]
MPPRNTKRVKAAHHDSPHVIIGKKGFTKEVLKEIDNRLDRQEVVKVKMLRTAVGTGRERKLAAEKVAQSLGARLMGVRGRTFVLYRPRKK